MILRSHHGALQMLSKTKGKKFEIILNNTPSIIKAIQVLFQYLLGNKLNMDKTVLNSLKPHREYIRKIAHGNLKVSKTTVQKSGSILNTILTTVVPFLTMLI